MVKSSRSSLLKRLTAVAFLTTLAAGQSSAQIPKRRYDYILCLADLQAQGKVSPLVKIGSFLKNFKKYSDECNAIWNGESPIDNIGHGSGHAVAVPVDWFPFCTGNTLAATISAGGQITYPVMVAETVGSPPPEVLLLQSRTGLMDCPGQSNGPSGTSPPPPSYGLMSQSYRSFITNNGSLAIAQAQGNGVIAEVVNPDLSLISSATYSTGPNASILTLADFNSDGNIDMAVLNAGSGPSEPGSISILPGNGDGTFQTAVNVLSAANLFSMASGDFNHDGKPDLIVATSTGFTLLLGNGDGTFHQGPPIATVGGPVAVADVNNDGFDDIVIGQSIADNAVLSGGVLLGNGDGTFQPLVEFPAPPPGSLTSKFVSLAIADLNQDGNPDIVGLAPGYLAVLKGNGDGTFQTAATYAAPIYEEGPDSLIVADIDGDGNLDVVIGNGDAGLIGPSADTQSIFVLLGNGDCTLQGSAFVGVGAVGGNHSQMAVADFDSDGKPDVLFNDQYGELYLSVNQGNFEFTTSSPVAAGFGYPVAADVNGDGKPDLVGTDNLSGNTGSNVLVMLGNGDGTFQPASSYPAGPSPSAIAVGDLNGDGKADIAVLTTAANGAGSVAILLATGTGFAPSVSYAVGSYPNGIVLGDFNGDGKPDIAVSNLGSSTANPGVVSVLINNGNGTFQNATSLTTGASPIGLATADLDGDDNLDLAVVFGPVNNPGVSLLFGNGNGSFQNAVTLPTEQYPSSILVGDFNYDGIPDLAITHQIDTTILFGQGGGSFFPEIGLIAGNNLGSIALADFNGDSRPDLIASTTFGGFFIFPGAAPLSVTPVPVTLASSPSGLAVTLDGFACTTPCTFLLNPGDQHTIAVAVTTQPSSTTGVAYSFASWSDNGAASHTITAPSAAATYTATFTTQYLLTTQVVANKPGVGGSIAASPPSATGYYSAGTTVQLTADPGPGYYFDAWLGALTGTTNPQSITINAPAEVTAGFEPNPCAVAEGGKVNVVDAQAMINEALGMAAPGNDLNGDGAVSVVDIQIVIDAALGLGCKG